MKCSVAARFAGVGPMTVALPLRPMTHGSGLRSYVSLIRAGGREMAITPQRMRVSAAHAATLTPSPAGLLLLSSSDIGQDIRHWT